VLSRRFFVQLCMTIKEKQIVLDILNGYKLFGIEYLDTIDILNSENINKTLPNTVEQLIEHIDHCHLCNLSHNKSIMRLYNLDYKKVTIMVVNLNDNLYSNEIVFKAFQDDLSKSFNLSINQFYFGSILKCKIENSKIDLKNSLEICSDYLKQEIAILKPKIILVIDGAFDYMKINFNQENLIRLIDPLYIYKNPSEKIKMKQDLEKIKLILEKK